MRIEPSSSKFHQGLQGAGGQSLHLPREGRYGGQRDVHLLRRRSSPLAKQSVTTVLPSESVTVVALLIMTVASICHLWGCAPPASTAWLARSRPTAVTAESNGLNGFELTGCELQQEAEVFMLISWLLAVQSIILLVHGPSWTRPENRGVMGNFDCHRASS